MPLLPGTTLGPYEIVSALGAGGMGEVYRAKDTRLDRTVAVKILPEHLAQNTEAKQRFEREARSISTLNHANICALYDVGTQDGTSYLVMEFVQGETLEARLLKGSIPLKQVVEYGIQICDALEKAHRAGIVHRDLKPGNIMLTPAGAKLLDFGLAKPVASMLAKHTAPQTGGHTPSSPTINMTSLTATPQALTQQGSIVGTLQFMAPEVLQGEDADARSDIFSFGCVLYEMVTGKRAFAGKSQISVMSAILEKEPEPIATLQPTAPAALEYVVQTCLEKEPDSRFQTAHDVKLQLAWIAKEGSQSSSTAVTPLPKKRQWAWPVAIVAAAVAVVLLAAARGPSRQDWPVLKTNILPPDGTIFETLYRNGAPTLSPDGKEIAFVGRKDAKNVIWLRRLDSLEASPLHGTEDGFFPFWAPDGSSLGFFMHGKLWRIPAGGGEPTPICDAAEGRGATWGRDNVILMAPAPTGPIMQVAAGGGTPKPITKTPVVTANISDRWPVILPDGKHFLYLHSPEGDAEDSNEIRFASLGGGEEKLVLRGRYYTFQYVYGWLFAGLKGSLKAWKFDAENGTTKGDGVRVVDKIASDDITAAAVFAVSSKGLLLYQESSSVTGDRHVWVDATGKPVAQISEPGFYGAMRISPDGSRVATGVWQKNGESPLWVWDLNGGTRAPLTSGKEVADSPVWSPDGKMLYFGSIDANGHEEVREVPSDGSEPEKTLIPSEGQATPFDVSSDGKWLLFAEVTNGAGSRSFELKAFPLVAGLQPFTVGDSVTNARLRPRTGDWLAYQSETSGRSEVYLTRFPRAGAKFQISQNGGTEPLWSKDGKTLYYLDNLQRVTAVSVQVGPDTVQLSPPQILFQTGVRQSIWTGGYDVARDGKFLLVNSVVDSTAPVVLITNWESLLKQN